MILSGWWDLNPRPVAAATALPWFVELVSTASSFVVPLALRGCGSACTAFATYQNPWHSTCGRLRLASVVAVNTISQILAKTYILSLRDALPIYVAMKHRLCLDDFIGLVGFEPTACRRGDRSTVVC